MFQKMFREEPEVLALAAIVLLALFTPPLRLPSPRVQWDLETMAPLDQALPRIDQALPRIQFIRFR
jgi:hypothetical protein